jgi:hypothetical protein
MIGEETDNGIGCILWVIALGLLMFFISHGPEIADKILGH